MTMSDQLPYIIVLGNEKGGTGKSTVSMHVISQLLRLGYEVGTIDVDARQGTLTRYIENRRSVALTKNPDLPMPDHIPILASAQVSKEEAALEEKANFETALNTHKGKDFIVIDTPGSDSYLSRLAHSYADTLITPLNDSFIDLDMLVRMEVDGKNTMRPSTYAEMVWEQKKNRLMRDKQNVDWIVVRNRLSHLRARNKIEMQKILNALAARIGFRLAAGFSERVIFRELFLSGLTLLDMAETGQTMTVSHVAARQELRDLMNMINLPNLKEELAKAS